MSRAAIVASLALGAYSLMGCTATLTLRGLPTAPSEKAEQVGPGYILAAPPKDTRVATNMMGQRVEPKVTSDFSGVPISNKWWSSLIWHFDPKNPYSQELFAEPMAFRAEPEGMGVSAPIEPQIKPREYMYRYDRDLLVGLDGMKSPDTRVAAYSDWTVTAEWKSGNARLRATIGHGIPYAYFERFGGGDAVVNVGSKVTGKGAGGEEEREEKELRVVQQKGPMVVFTVDSHNFALFGPMGSRWETTKRGFKSSLAGKRHFSLATLPNLEPATIALYYQHAYSFVRDTKVSWQYDEAKAELRTTYKLTTEQMDDCGGDCGGVSRDPLIALFRHQWMHMEDDAFLPGTFASPRGTMKTLATRSFETTMPFAGVLPVLPKASDEGLSHDISEAANTDDLFPLGLGEKPSHDAYWEGKSFGRLSNVADIANQEGMITERDRLLVAMKNELNDWFDGQEPKQFFYEAGWHSLVGLPASYGSSAELNDHHFHYGYFVQAAAAIARYDADWAKKWAPCINLLISDVANTDREDTRFPFLRHMDVYAGHSWANGPSQFAEGNNQEASSEDINTSTALILWGAEIGRKDIRDLGIYLYLHQVAAAEQYWFDVDKQNFPKGYKHAFAAMVWGAGAKYDTWFDQDPVLLAGINLLPFHGGSLYLGHHPAYAKAYFEDALRLSHGQITTWRDYLLMYLATFDGKRAHELFDEDTAFTPEFGNTMAMTKHWIFNLEQLGRPEPSVRGDQPLSTVFLTSPRKKTHAAFNPTTKPLVVTFTDGAKLQVPPMTLRSDFTPPSP